MNRFVVPLAVSALTLAAVLLAFWIVAALQTGESAGAMKPIVIGREDGGGRSGEGPIDAVSSTTTTIGDGIHQADHAVETVGHPIHTRMMAGAAGSSSGSAVSPPTSSPAPSVTSPGPRPTSGTPPATSPTRSDHGDAPRHGESPSAGHMPTSTAGPSPTPPPTTAPTAGPTLPPRHEAGEPSHGGSGGDGGGAAGGSGGGGTPTDQPDTADHGGMSGAGREMGH